jgi:glucan-binding YG repeat protein
MKYPLTVAHVWKLSEADSTPATCTTDGVDYYICEKDGQHSHNPSNEYAKDPAFYTEKVPALGHDWLDWEVVEEYKKDGKEYQLMIRECAREGCHSTENQIVEKGVDPAPVPPVVKNGLVKDEDGVWRYYEDDKFVEKTDIVTFQGGDFWVVKGVLASDANGLTICPDGKAYCLVNGQIQRKDGFAEYRGQWFMLKNGELDENANGLYDYDGGTFVFAAGKLRTDVNGLWQNPKDSKWYFLANGQVQKVSQVAEYNGEFFLVKDGILDTEYKGTYEYDGRTFIVVNGQLYEPLTEEEPAA